MKQPERKWTDITQDYRKPLLEVMMSVDTKAARDYANAIGWANARKVFLELADEVDRLSKESFDYRDAWMELSTKHEALLEAAKALSGSGLDPELLPPLVDAIADCGGDDEC